MPHLIVLDEQKLAYVVTPKVASTTLLHFCYALAGLDLQGANPRKAARRRKTARRLTALGVRSMMLSQAELAEQRDRLADYYWIAARRHPLKRMISNYHSKVHRYAQAFDRRAFRAASLRRLLDGPRAIDDSRYLSLHVARRIAFDEMVRGLQHHGIDFDEHFCLQTEHLCPEAVSYHRILKQEALEDELKAVCSDTGLSYPYPHGIPSFNTSGMPRQAPVTPDPASIHVIETLYRQDYAQLGYPSS